MAMPCSSASRAARMVPPEAWRNGRRTPRSINPAGSEILSRLVVEENQQPALADLFSTQDDYQQFLQTLFKEEKLSEHIVYLETRDAKTRLISLSARLVRDENQQPDLITGILEDVTERHREEAEAQATIEKLQSSLLFLHESLDKLGREVVICKMDTSIEQLARIMTARKATAVLVAAENETIIGIITDHDLRARALAENINLKTPVHTIMSSPIARISENALIYEALMRMEEKGLRHLAVEDRSGKIVSVIDNKALIQFQRYGPIVLTREISRSVSVEELANQTARLPLLAKTLTESSANPRHITNMVSSICNAVTERLIEMAVEEFGPPPASFAFIGMGSQGRQEQTLLTDQDNGIIYQLSAGQNAQQVQDYFQRLGSRVCDGLHLSGYPYCRGQVMAGNPAWCRSLESWKNGFATWVQKSELQEIINLSIFFDFRTIYGDKELTRELRQHVYAVLQEKPGIFYHFAQNALLFKPPMRLLGTLYVGEHGGEINLKDAMMPMVSFARLYALHHQVNQVHTLERLEALADRNFILSSTRDEITSAYNFLMQLRLQTQLEAIQAGQTPHNNIQPSRLGNMQQELLKQAFVQISAVQKKISYDFLGGM
jgi:CBS domain-containing protein